MWKKTFHRQYLFTHTKWQGGHNPRKNRKTSKTSKFALSPSKNLENLEKKKWPSKKFSEAQNPRKSTWTLEKILNIVSNSFFKRLIKMFSYILLLLLLSLLLLFFVKSTLLNFTQITLISNLLYCERGYPEAEHNCLL